MTRLAVLLLVVAPWAASAAPFEGTIDMEFEVGGPMGFLAAAMLPTELSVAVRGSDVRTSIVGGLLEQPLHTVALADGTIFLVDDGERTVRFQDSNDGNSATPTSIVAGDGRRTVAGYDCAEWRVTVDNEGKPQEMTAWVTTDLELPDLSRLGQNAAGGGMLAIQGVKGVVLQLDVLNPEITMTLAATQVSTKKPKKSLFKQPKGYAVVTE